MAAMGTAVCSPPRPARGAMVPAITHCRKPKSADPVPGCSGTAAEASAPAFGPTSPWAVIRMKKPTSATVSGIENQTAPTASTAPATPVAASPTLTNTRAGTRSAYRAATRAAAVIPAALTAKSTEYCNGVSPFMDCSTYAEVAT